MNGLTIRPFREADIPALLALMKALARFEGYIDDFQVTEEDLRLLGLGGQPVFGALVAERQGRPDGYAAYYFLPFTYRMRPTLVLKELYVCASARSAGTGRQLFEAVRKVAEEAGAARMEWLVLPDNHRAAHFYEMCGASRDLAWDRWGMAVTPVSRQSG